MISSELEHKAQRNRLFRVLLTLLSLCIVPIALSQLSDVKTVTLFAPFIAVEALIVCAAVARFRNVLSAPLAFALSAWAVAAMCAAAGEAALEVGATLQPPAELVWLSPGTCKQNGSYLILLCPFAFALDIIMALFYGLAYVAFAVGWLLQNVGAPALFGGALMAVVAGVSALRRHLRQARAALPTEGDS